jgi:hypothetical protein
MSLELWQARLQLSLHSVDNRIAAKNLVIAQTKEDNATAKTALAKVQRDLATNYYEVEQGGYDQKFGPGVVRPLPEDFEVPESESGSSGEEVGDDLELENDGSEAGDGEEDYKSTDIEVEALDFSSQGIPIEISSDSE